jgi:hypothetical protein
MANQLFTVFLLFVGLVAMYMAGVAMGWLPTPNTMEMGPESEKQDERNIALGVTAGVVMVSLVLGYFS